MQAHANALLSEQDHKGNSFVGALWFDRSVAHRPAPLDGQGGPEETLPAERSFSARAIILLSRRTRADRWGISTVGRSGRESLIISAGAALLLPAVVFVVLPLNLFAANAEELSGLAGLGLMAAAAFVVSTLVFWPAFLIGLRSRGWSSVSLAVLTLGLCILLWRLTAAVGERIGPAWVQALLDLAAAGAALFIVTRMSLRNLYVTAGVVSICLLVSSAVSHAALVISHTAYFLGALPVELEFSAATSGAAASMGSAPLPGAPEESETEPAPGFTGNVYHLVLDGFQGEAYEKIAADRPDMLPGFTYFPNFVSNAGRTIWSNGMLIRGVPLSELGDELPRAWVNRAFSDGLWADLHRNGVAVHQYPHYDSYCFAGAVVCKSSVQLLKTAGRGIFVDLWFLNLLPQTANRLLAAATGEGGEADPAADGAKDDWSYGFSVTRYLAGLSGIDPRDIPAFSMLLFGEMLDDEESRSSSGQYVFVDRVSGSGVADGVGRRVLRRWAGKISAPRLAG